MRLGALLFSGLLAGAGAAERGLDGADAEADKAGKRTGGVGFLERALREAKRLGEAIDPDAAAQVQQAWQELQPDIRQATEDVLQANREFKDLREGAAELWSDVQRAVSGAGEPDAAGDAFREGAELEWEGIRRDAVKVATGVFGEVLGEVTNEMAATFESLLSEALSEGNVRAASQLWHRLLDTPGVQLLARDKKLGMAVQRAVRRYLRAFMSEETAAEAERAVDATAEFALHFAGLSRNAGKTDYEVFEELSHKMCHLQGAVEKLWPWTERALPLLGYEQYSSRVEGAIRASALSRMTLTVSASALLGLNPGNDPFLMTVIASYSLGHVTKDVAQNLAALFVKVFMDPSVLDPWWTEEGGAGKGGRVLVSPVDLATALVSGGSTCQELGHQAFAFFEVVKRALAQPGSPETGLVALDDNEKTVRQESAPFTEAGPSSELLVPNKALRPVRELGTDGLVLRQAIWAAAVVDHSRFSARAVLFCLGVGFLLCGVLLRALFCWCWGRGCSRGKVPKWGVNGKANGVMGRAKTA